MMVWRMYRKMRMLMMVWRMMRNLKCNVQSDVVDDSEDNDEKHPG